MIVVFWLWEQPQAIPSRYQMLRESLDSLNYLFFIRSTMNLNRLDYHSPPRKQSTK